MPIWTPETGLIEARRRIKECGEKREETLDLGGLRLTEWPAELQELTWLKRLYLGPDEEARKNPNFYPPLAPERCNALSAPPRAIIKALAQLEELDLAGDRIGDEGAAALARLDKLTSLDLGCNQIGDDGAAALARLDKLTSLDLGCNQIGDDGAAALARLDRLTSLALGYNRIGADGAAALARLDRLTSLALESNRIGAAGAAALARLDKLTSLDLGDNRIGADGAAALARLDRLTSLALGDNRIGDDGAAALARLDRLTSLDLGYNGIGDDGAAALARLDSLTSLDLGYNEIGDAGAAALARLDRLTSLDLRDNRIGADGAAALARLATLTSLALGYNEIGDEGAAALARLDSLTSLDLESNEIGDIRPLTALKRLRRIVLSENLLDDPAAEFWRSPALEEAILENARLPGVPAEVLSENSSDNCLPRLRAHLDDLEAGGEALRDVKLMLLGNGRVGKTQIRNRLKGADFEEEPDSTHGVVIASAELPAAREGEAPTPLKIWDFGGQDIFLGTHALFLKTRAVFPVVWSKEDEGKEGHATHDHWFRNYPLPYWLNFVRRLAGPNSPLLIVQNKCDAAREEEPFPPVKPEQVKEFEFIRPSIHYSAKKDRGRPTLTAALQEAVAFLREERDEPLIGKGRAFVKAELERRREEAAGQPAEARENRWLTREEFYALCERFRGDYPISDPDLFLDYLHQTGVAFYKPGLFEGRIVIDQQWALNAIYAVFERGSGVYRRIKANGGRFTAEDLAVWLWNDQNHSPAAQQLFLDMMRSCAICFPLIEQEGEETRFVAPDLLPEKEALSLRLLESWEDGAETLSVRSGYGFLPPSLLRSLMAKIGEKAGLRADYWRGGFYFFDAETRSRAQIEEEEGENGAGALKLRAQKGDAARLLANLLKMIEQEENRLGVEGELSGDGLDAALRIKDGGRRRAPATEKQGHAAPDSAGAEPPESRLRPELEELEGEPWFVSYAWDDPASRSKEETRREKAVDRLCEKAKAEGIEILRDKDVLTLGDNIWRFMRWLTKGGRVYVVISAAYLRSVNCMFELYGIWRHSQHQSEDAREDFFRRTRFIFLRDAQCFGDKQRAEFIRHWRGEKKRREKLQAEFGGAYGDQDTAELKLVSEFHLHVSSILGMATGPLAQRIDDIDQLSFDD